ncbi:MAG TPA: EamA family transporter [Candidatus Humimicrobiaceae bacterium]
MKSEISDKKFFYILIIILTIIINLFTIIASKYIGVNLEFSKIFVFWLFVLIITYGLKFTFWFFLNRKFQLSYIYPILSLNYFISLFLGKFLFKEDITINKIIGSVVIVVGVLIITMSSKKLEGV